MTQPMRSPVQQHHPLLAVLLANSDFAEVCPKGPQILAAPVDLARVLVHFTRGRHYVVCVESGAPASLSYDALETGWERC
jgi:hypothetical protein